LNVCRGATPGAGRSCFFREKILAEYLPDFRDCWEYSGENYLWREGKQLPVLVHWVRQLANLPEQ